MSVDTEPQKQTYKFTTEWDQEWAARRGMLLNMPKMMRTPHPAMGTPMACGPMKGSMNPQVHGMLPLGAPQSGGYVRTYCKL